MSDYMRSLIVNVYEASKQGSLLDLQYMYENIFQQLTGQYFEKRTLPEWNEIATLVEEDEQFSIIYKELYFRHNRLQGGPSLDDRLKSFYNYCGFFNMLLTAKKPVELYLPDIWLWELMDEFIQQYQDFSLYRSCLIDKTEYELREISMKHTNQWSVLCALNTFYSFIDLSGIRKQFKDTTKDANPKMADNEFGRSRLYKVMSYFSIVGLARVEARLGDYYQVIKAFEPFGVQKVLEFVRIPAYKICISYHVGFAYMMMRRYADAIAIFSQTLLFAENTNKVFSADPYRNELVNKQMEQMLYLLTICNILQPQRIAEPLQNMLREKNFQEPIRRLQAGDLEMFKTFFVIACPQFLNPVPPVIDGGANKDYSLEVLEQQLTVFLSEVRQQSHIPSLRTFMKVYYNLPISKMTNLLNATGEQRTDEQTLANLLSFKHKMHNVQSGDSKGVDAKLLSDGDLDFYIDDDMIHVVDSNVSFNYSEFFTSKINQFNDLSRDLSNMKL